MPIPLRLERPEAALGADSPGTVIELSAMTTFLFSAGASVAGEGASTVGADSATARSSRLMACGGALCSRSARAGEASGAGACERSALDVCEHPASRDKATKPTIDLRKRAKTRADGDATAIM
jgi:hypothetical protein